MSEQQHRAWCEDADAGHPAGADCRLYGDSIAHELTATSVAATAPTTGGPALIEVTHTAPGRAEVLYLTPDDAVAIGLSLAALGEKFTRGREPRRRSTPALF